MRERTLAFRPAEALAPFRHLRVLNLAEEDLRRLHRSAGRQDVEHALEVAKLAPYRVATVLAPAWTTDWMTADAREKLRAYGIAPPTGNCASDAPREKVIRFVPKALPAPTCPRCGSAHTERLAQFGSTACKALYRCDDCGEPFEAVKPL